MTIRSLKGDVKECSANKVGSKWLSKSRKNKLDKTNTALNAKSQELYAKSQELEEAKAQLEAKNQSINNFVEAMRLYAVEEKKEEDKYTVGELWGKYEGPINCNRLTIREKIIYNTLAKRYNKRYPSYSQYKQLTDPLTMADIAYVEKLKEQRKQCIKFLALNGENGCLERIEELQYELEACNIKNVYNSDFDDEDESSDDEDESSDDVEYRDFDVEGRGKTRVKYIKNPINSKGNPTVQGRGGYYYGVTDVGEKVTVRGRSNVHTVRNRNTRYATSVSAARRSRFSENKSNVKVRTFVVNKSNILEKKLIF